VDYRDNAPTRARRSKVGDLQPELETDKAKPPATGATATPYVPIRDMPASERPRERLAAHGSEALSIAELIAIVWRTGTSGSHRESALDLATRALALHGGLSGLARASLADLERTRGIGPVKAIEIKAALELARRLALASPEDRRVVRTPLDIVDMLGPDIVNLEREHLHVVLLSTKHHVIGVRELYRGTLNSSVVRVGELFRHAIREDAAAIIVVHNHPSGDPTPSNDDVRITADAVAAGRLVEIDVLDHVIVGSRTLRWTSLREKGLGFGTNLA
jgi:DNA repair protein RadC